jgi:hypothetical protein
VRRPADATQLVDDEVGGPLIRGSANAIKAVTGAQAGYSDVEEDLSAGAGSGTRRKIMIHASGQARAAAEQVQLPSELLGVRDVGAPREAGERVSGAPSAIVR